MGLPNHMTNCAGCDALIQTSDATYDDNEDAYCEECAVNQGVDDWQEAKARDEGQRDAWLYLKSAWM